MRRDFVANVSHELKTPLASIKAYAETLRLGAIHDDQKNIQFLDQIETQAELLNRQIQDLLEIARIESGSAAFKIETVELNTLCERSVKHLLPQALQRDVKLVFNSENETLNADAEANGVVTILNNLISNAIHYTPAGGQVTVKTRLAGEFSIIEVIDTGIGISQEHQTRVFERFYRVDKARSRDLGGTGLGLSIVKHLTQSMGGQVELESQIGKGSTFRVCLPTG
jgi:two-component system phosphate regulon sensor histidine kinase PhoR